MNNTLSILHTSLEHLIIQSRPNMPRDCTTSKFRVKAINLVIHVHEHCAFHAPSIAFRHSRPQSAARTAYVTQARHSLSSRSCPPTLSAPSERFGYYPHSKHRFPTLSAPSERFGYYPHSKHRFPAPSSKWKDVANQCLQSRYYQ